MQPPQVAWFGFHPAIDVQLFLTQWLVPRIVGRRLEGMHRLGVATRFLSFGWRERPHPPKPQTPEAPQKTKPADSPQTFRPPARNPRRVPYLGSLSSSSRAADRCPVHAASSLCWRVPIAAELSELQIFGYQCARISTSYSRKYWFTAFMSKLFRKLNQKERKAPPAQLSKSVPATLLSSVISKQV